MNNETLEQAKQQGKCLPSKSYSYIYLFSKKSRRFFMEREVTIPKAVYN